jgi:hypothetical protein
MRLPALVLAVLLGAASASAATVEQIVALSKAGVSESVILALIDRDKTIFTLDSDELMMLKREGVSEPIVLAMLKSGRPEAEAAVRAENELRMANYLATTAPAPDVVVVGHEPDRPNTSPYYGLPPFDRYLQTGLLGTLPYAVGVPYGFPVLPAPHGVLSARRVAPSQQTPSCIAPGNSGSVTERGVGFIAGCLQPSPSLRTHRR